MKNRSFIFWKVLLLLGLASYLLSPSALAQDSNKVQLSAAGEALLPIVISSDASETSRQTAQTLAEYLEKISGASFAVKTGDGKSGIVVGTIREFPLLESTLDPNLLGIREAYLLRSHNRGIFLIGTAERGMQYAMWDLLQRLGYRQFFPGENWEIVPQQANIAVAVDVQERPEFLLRDFFFNHSSWPDNLERWERWQTVNRVGKSFSLNTAHAWDDIRSRYKSEFADHPGYFALLKGERKTTGSRLKFCLSNAGLRRLVARYALDFFEENPEEDTVSIEPSDSGGWCECDPCQAIGTPSDRMVVLANEVIDTVRTQYPQKYVAFYAYSHHAAIPKNKLHPGAIVSVTTALRKGKDSFEQLIDGWRKQGATTGIRDYMSFTSWEGFDAPYYSRAGRVEEYVEALSGFAKLPDKFYRAEMGDNWGPNGLGHYLAARILWDSREAEHLDELTDDFLEKSFGAAKAPMRRFYGLINGIDGTFVPPFDGDAVAQLYQILDEAWKSTSDAQVRARLGDLVLYVHYLEKYHQFLYAPQDQKQNYFENTLRHAYRIHSTHMVHSRTMYLKLFSSKFGAEGVIPASAAATVPEKENPWMSSEPFTEQEILNILNAGLRAASIPSKTWTVTLASASQAVAPAPVEFHTRGPSRMMLYFPEDGEAQITPRKISSSIFNDPRSYHIRDARGEVIAQGAMKNNTPITLLGKAKESYEFFVFIHNYGSSQKFEVNGAAVAVQANLDHGRLHLFEDPTALYVYVPPDTEQWNLTLESFTPGETARVLVKAPDGKQMALLETTREKKQKTSIPGREGFWKIEVTRAATGILYSTGITFDPVLSPWASLDKNYLLKIE